MMGPTHREWGAVSGAVLSAVSGCDPVEVVVAAFIGYRCATWPDRVEKMKYTPFKKHRGMSHSWELNAVVMLLAWWLPPVIDYPVWGLALAWNSHLTGDFLFGLAGWGRGAGVPLFFGTYHCGLNVFKVGNMTEKGVRIFLKGSKYAVVATASIYSLIHLAGAM